MAGIEIALSLIARHRQTNAEADRDILAEFFETVVKGPMGYYREISQYGAKQGQTYFTHALDGITVFHRLRQVGVIDITDVEEQLLLTAFTIHDINKIWPWRYKNEAGKPLSYVGYATTQNIERELTILGFDEFFPGWQSYLEDIRLLSLHHQHDAKPLEDLDHTRRPNYKHDYDRLKNLGDLMQAVDNLDLSHTLGEVKHKQEFLRRLNSCDLCEKRWDWVTHRLGENRGIVTNIIHNTTVAYLTERHTGAEGADLVDLLYYPEGVAYLLRDREKKNFDWTAQDTNELAGQVARAVATKQRASFKDFIKASPPGIKVDKAALESGASFSQIMDVIYGIVDRKRYKEDWHIGYSQRLRTDFETAEVANQPGLAEQVAPLLASSQPIVPLEQALFQKGELATAYRNLLEDHLKDRLKTPKKDAWAHLYALMELPTDAHRLYAQVDGYRRGYFLARDYQGSLDSLYNRLLDNLTKLTGEAIQADSKTDDGLAFREYLATNLEVSVGGQSRDFKAQLNRYIKDEHRQCSNCSSALRTEEWMAANAPGSVGVQSFSNRLVGGSSREPKRNICAVCRVQFILEKLAWSTHRDKHGGDYTTFYFHFYPYSFFTEPYLRAMYESLKGVQREDNRNFFLRPEAYFREWDDRQRTEFENRFKGYSTKVNGVGVPNFTDAFGNTPTLPLNAPGSNYGQQFIFALTHALMLADFFACRVVMSRTPVPLFSGEYLDERGLALFVDGVPRNLRWLLPVNEFCRLNVYYESNKPGGGPDYLAHEDKLADEQPDGKGRAAYENVLLRLRALYQLTAELKGPTDSAEEILLELATRAADDPLWLYFQADRAIEKRLKDGGKAKGGGSKEWSAVYMSKRIVPLLDKLTKE